MIRTIAVAPNKQELSLAALLALRFSLVASLALRDGQTVKDLTALI